MPAGCEVIRPLPFPPGTIAMLPLAKWNGSQTVMIACRSVPKSPPIVPMMTADCALGTRLVATGKVALVAPAAAGLSLDSATTRPPAGAAAESVTVPVAGSPPTTSVGDTLSVESAAEEEGGGVGDGCASAVQPDNLAAVG